MGNLGLIPELGRSLGEGKGYPLQYSSLENPMDCIVHGVAKSQARLGDLHSLHFTSCHCYQDMPRSRNVCPLSCKLALPSALTIYLYNDSDAYIYTHICIYVFFFRFFPLKSYYKILSLLRQQEKAKDAPKPMI